VAAKEYYCWLRLKLDFFVVAVVVVVVELRPQPLPNEMDYVSFGGDGGGEMADTDGGDGSRDVSFRPKIKDYSGVVVVVVVVVVGKRQLPLPLERLLAN
jgi:hypothetical protein